MSSKKYVLLGIVLLLSQIMATVGRIQNGQSISANLHGGINDVIFLAGYFFIGIIGAVLLIIGLIKRARGK